MQFAVERRTKPCWNLAQFPKDFHGRLSGEGQGIIGLGKITREETLQQVQPTPKRDEHQAALLCDAVDAALQAHAHHSILGFCAGFAELPNNIRVCLANADELGTRKRRVLVDLDFF